MRPWQATRRIFAARSNLTWNHWFLSLVLADQAPVRELVLWKWRRPLSGRCRWSYCEEAWMSPSLIFPFCIPRAFKHNGGLGGTKPARNGWYILPPSVYKSFLWNFLSLALVAATLLHLGAEATTKTTATRTSLIRIFRKAKQHFWEIFSFLYNSQPFSSDQRREMTKSTEDKFSI